MSALNNVTSVLLAIGATAATYLVMHVLVAPRLTLPAVDVPALSGLSPEQARSLMDPRGLLLVLDGERVPEGDKIAPGTLFEQHPLGGSRLHPGEKVHVMLARAPQLERVPALAGQALDAAKRALGDRGLRVGDVAEVASSTVAAGLIVKTQPEAGADVRKDDAVDLFVSKGGETIAVPNLRGRSAGGARQILEQAGLQLGEQRKGVDDNAGDGVVLKQAPAAGTQVPKGQKVDIVINE